MATVALTTFLPEITPHVPGCPEPVILNALVTAATEFCTRTLAWQERIASVQVTSGSFPYDIDVDTHAALARVMSVTVGTLKLTPTSYAALDQTTNWDTQTGTPVSFLIQSDGDLLVYPLPSESMALTMTISNTVARSATVLEKFLHTRWRDVLVAGALRIIHAMPDKSWSKPDMVALHTQKFEQGVTAASVDRNRSQMVSTQAVIMRPFA